MDLRSFKRGSIWNTGAWFCHSRDIVIAAFHLGLPLHRLANDWMFDFPEGDCSIDEEQLLWCVDDNGDGQYEMSNDGNKKASEFRRFATEALWAVDRKDQAS
jgi:hypothetical protein